MKKTKNAIKDKFGNSSSMKAVSRISDKDIYLKKEEDKAIIEDLNQEQIRCLKLGRDKKEEWLDMNASEDWKLQWADKDDPTTKVECMTSAPPNECNTFKVTGQLDYPPHIVFKVLCDPKNRTKYAPEIAS